MLLATEKKYWSWRIPCINLQSTVLYILADQYGEPECNVKYMLDWAAQTSRKSSNWEQHPRRCCAENSTHRQSISSHCSVAHVTRACMPLPAFKKPRAADLPFVAYIYEPAEEAFGSSVRCNAHGGAKLARDQASLEVEADYSLIISGVIDRDDEVQLCCCGDLDGGRRHGLSGHVLLREAAGGDRRRSRRLGSRRCRLRFRQASPAASQAALSAAAGSGAVVSDQQLQRWMPTTVIRVE